MGLKKTILLGLGILFLLALATPSLASTEIKSCDYIENCEGVGENKVCQATVYGGCIFMKDSAGNWKYATEVLNTAWEGGYSGNFRISWHDKWVKIKPYIIYNSNQYTLDQIHNAYPEIVFSFAVGSDLNRYKYSISIDNIPQELEEGFESIKLYLLDSQGLTWDDVKRRGKSLVIKNRVELSFGDLADNNFDFKLVDKRTVLIGNIADNIVGGSLNLDPVVQSFSTVDDADVMESNATQTFNNIDIYQYWCRAGCSPDHVRESFVKYNLAGLPADITILDARWSAYCEGTGASGASLQIWEVPNSAIWDETNVTWNTRPAVNLTTGRLDGAAPAAASWFTNPTNWSTLIERYAGSFISFKLNTSGNEVSGQDFTSKEGGVPHYINVTFILNSDSPIFSIGSPANATWLDWGESLDITGTASDVNPDSIFTNDSRFTWNGTYSSWGITNNTALPSGVLVINISANDTLGNTNSSILTAYISPTALSSESYPSDSLESLTYLFNASLIFEAGQNPIVYLQYNGTAYQATQTGFSTGAANYEKSLTLPLIEGAFNENRTFWWNITDSLHNYNATPPHTQTVFRMYITNCTAPAVTGTINFTFLDEITNATVATDVSTYWNIWATLGDGTIVRNYTNSMDGRTVAGYCIYPSWANLTANLNLYYSATNYVSREYHLVNKFLQNTTEDIFLYMLSEGNATTFQLTVRDNSYKYYPGVLVRTLKYQASTNSFIETESCVTNDDATCLSHLILEKIDYRFVVVKDGNIIHTTSSIKVYCPEHQAYEKCRLTVLLAPQLTTFHYVWDEINGLSYGLSFNNVTNISSLSYSFIAGTIKYIRFKVSQGITTICNSNSTALAGILTCDLNNYNGTVKEQIYISRSDDLAIYTYYLDLGHSFGGFGATGLFFLIIIVLTIAIASVVTGNPIAAIVLTVGALIIGLVTGIGGLGTASVIMIAVAGAFVVFKLKQ